MNAKEYQQAAERTLESLRAITTTPETTGLLLGALGVTGEAGEIADHIKKHVFHGHDLDREHLIKEVGDVMWYLSAICTTLGIELGTAMQQNVDKLKRRYPDGFSHEASINRTE